MLESTDYEAIANIVRNSIEASEMRMKDYVQESIVTNIGVSEARIKDFVENIVSGNIHESENRVLSEVDRVHISLQTQMDELRMADIRRAAN